MVLDGFHSSVANWFKNTFDEPTDIQVKAWPEIQKRRNILISAPTGSGKTLAAFLSTIDDLVKQGLEGRLEEKTHVVYVSPLKALSNDIERNLQMPLKGIGGELKKTGSPEIKIKVLVRTGDTSTSERTAMIKHPPHILVTTPESLYLLLTSENGRKMLSDVDTAIIDEIHALFGNKRGSHLSLSLERLDALTRKDLIRIGLSATQKPIENVARFLVGNGVVGKMDELNCRVIDAGHKRELDLKIEVPRSPLNAVMSNEVWGEIYEKLEDLINEHKTTLIFVNTRRLAERMTHNLTDRLGTQIVAAHHGSISKEIRLDAEQRLKSGSLRALVATSSLELGIDIGAIDLVCQIGSPRSIAILLQRVGRSGHTVKGTPKGRLFPLSLDELVECSALLDAIRRGELDITIMPEKPLDILAQQLVAEVSSRECKEAELFDLVCRAYPYRDLSLKEFEGVIDMLSKGYATQKGRRGAYIHRDIVNGRLRARRGARLTALVSGGAIPDNFDYDVILEPTNTFIGTVNEDFAIESVAGDIFLLGNNSWRILGVQGGKVRVEDAQGQPPTIPFWFGEAPARTAELSFAVSGLREEISGRVGNLDKLKNADDDTETLLNDEWKKESLEWLEHEVGLGREASDQLVTYLGAVKAAFGVMPSQETLVMERFFDEAGAMHLVIHSPFGNRLNRAWGLALRKRFCRKFNFELQAAATEDSIILSLGATHSFPLDEVFYYLSPKTVRHILTQALLDSPMFGVRWRWNASRALAVLRRRAGSKVPPAIQRIQSEDLLALVFPDQSACQENITGEREIPDHPLVNQTIHDCLCEAMDIDGIENLFVSIHKGEKKLVAKDLKEPSPLAGQILSARPYSFLDDAPLEERRSNAVQNRRWLDPDEAADLGKLDPGAVNAVKDEAWPQVRNADELHDALVLSGFLTAEEGIRGDGYGGWGEYFAELKNEGRASLLRTESGHEFWVAAERIAQMNLIFPRSDANPVLRIPEKYSEGVTSNEKAMVEILRGRLETLGPVRSIDLSKSMGIPVSEVESAFITLENEGFVFRGHFTPGIDDLEWCERRLLARIHKYTLKSLRREIEPVPAVDFMRFLFSWHALGSNEKREGPEALKEVLNQLEGFEAPAASWEGELLPSRVKDYDHIWLDMLCLSGYTLWGRFRSQGSEKNGDRGPGPIKSSPITFVPRLSLDSWKRLNFSSVKNIEHLSNETGKVVEVLTKRGASFFEDIVSKAGLLRSQVEGALGELVALGLLTSDSFSGLRSLLVESKYRTAKGRRRRNGIGFGMEEAGRWSLIDYGPTTHGGKTKPDAESLIVIARALLRRYGVVFRRLVDRENLAPPWRELVRVLRTLEARGEIRGGRFVEGVWGEQFALPAAVGKLRAVRRQPKTGELISISAADPLNLTGIMTPGRRVPSLFNNRILYRDGEPVAIKEGKELRFLTEFEMRERWHIRKTLIRRAISPKLRSYLGKGIV
jgi:ATP-dependent Lhr-like helicase